MTKNHRMPILLAGLGVGAAAGLLFARTPGVRLRRDIRKRAYRLKHFVNEQAEAVIDRAGNMVEDVQERLTAAQDFSNQAQAFSKQAIDAMKCAMDAASKATNIVAKKSRAVLHG
jgi:gas vesicle protein